MSLDRKISGVRGALLGTVVGVLFSVGMTEDARGQSAWTQSAYIKDADGLTAEMGYRGSFAFDYPTIVWSGENGTFVHVIRDRDGDGDFKTGIVDRQVIQGVGGSSLSFDLQDDVLVVGDPGLDGAKGADNCGGVVVFEWNASSHQYEAISHLATLDKASGILQWSPGLGQSVAIDGTTIVATTVVSGEVIVFRTAGTWSDIDSGFKGKRNPVLAKNSLDDDDCVGCGRFIVDRGDVSENQPWFFGGGNFSVMSHAVQVHEASNTIAIGDIAGVVGASSSFVHVIQDGDGDWPDGILGGDTVALQITTPALGAEEANLFGSSIELVELPGGELRLVVGSMGESTTSGTSRSAAYVLDSVGGSFSTHVATLLEPPSNAAYGFGISVAFGTADQVFVGSHASAEQGGNVYEFHNLAGVWTHVDTIRGNNTEDGDYFGRHVAFSDGTLVVCAQLEDDADTAVISTGPADAASDADDAPDEGAIYHFRLASP